MFKQGIYRSRFLYYNETRKQCLKCIWLTKINTIVKPDYKK